MAARVRHGRRAVGPLRLEVRAMSLYYTLMVSLSNHEPWAARPTAFAKATADGRSAKRGGWSTLRQAQGSGRACGLGG